jgi:hypothetical protein
MLAQRSVKSAHAYAGAASELIANMGVSALVTVVVLACVPLEFALTPPAVVFSRVLLWSSLALVAGAVYAVGARTYVIGAFASSLSALPLVAKRWCPDRSKVRAMEDAILHVLRDRPVVLAQVLLLEVAAQALLVLDVYWTLRSMGLSRSLGTALLVEALTKLANVVQFVGAAEGSYALVFSWLGMAAAGGFSLSIVKRVRSLAVAAVGLALFSTMPRSADRGIADERYRGKAWS